MAEAGTMRTIKHIILSALLVLSLLLLLMIWLSQPDQPAPVQSIQTISQQATTEPDNRVAVPPADRLPARPQPASITQPLAQPPAPIAEQNMSWMDVYRLKRLWQHCGSAIIDTLVEHEAAAEDVLTLALLERMSIHQEDWPSESQLSALQRLTARCQSAFQHINALPLPMLAVVDDQAQTSLYQQTQRQLDAWLLQMPPDSESAKALAELLKLIVRWRADVDEVVRTSKGSERTNQAAIDLLKAELKPLNDRLQQIQQAFREADADEQMLNDEWIDLYMQTQEIEDEIAKLLVLDKTERARAVATFEVSHNLLSQWLNTRNPDVFFEVQLALERNHNLSMFGHNPYKFNDRYEFKTPFIEYVSPGDVVRQLAGVEQSNWFDLVIHYATRLYHCELGADCGPNSEWVSYHCVTAYVDRHASSCGLSLAGFYQQHLSENHWSDVLYIRDLMRTLYAP
jgi:hypothetical protein